MSTREAPKKPYGKIITPPKPLSQMTRDEMMDHILALQQAALDNQIASQDAKFITPDSSEARSRMTRQEEENRAWSWTYMTNGERIGVIVFLSFLGLMLFGAISTNL